MSKLIVRRGLDFQLPNIFTTEWFKVLGGFKQLTSELPVELFTDVSLELKLK